LFGGTRLAKWVKGLGFSRTTDKEVDQLIERILATVGVNAVLADRIGDVAATVLSEFQIVHSDPNWVKDNVVAGVIRWFAGLPRKDVQNLVSVEDRILSDRSVKVRVAMEIMNDDAIKGVVDAKVREKLGESRTEEQPDSSSVQG
jgi:hypothetical protein